MPLEINEIAIAMRVSAGGRDQDGQRAAPGERAEEDREELIQECVRRVLQALKARSEP
jgi:hypothetical protein